MYLSPKTFMLGGGWVGVWMGRWYVVIIDWISKSRPEPKKCLSVSVDLWPGHGLDPKLDNNVQTDAGGSNACYSFFEHQFSTRCPKKLPFSWCLCFWAWGGGGLEKFGSFLHSYGFVKGVILFFTLTKTFVSSVPYMYIACIKWVICHS